MTQVSCKIIIDASADSVWQVLSDFGSACRYLALVEDCTVEGDGIGALRTLTSVDGSTIAERLEALDATARRLSYSLLTDTPFRDCFTTVAVRDLSRGQSEVQWSATFAADGLPVSEAADMLEGALAMNCLALKALMDAPQCMKGAAMICTFSSDSVAASKVKK